MQSMNLNGDRATDEELIELFSLESVEELYSIAAGKRGVLFINVCEGQWVKYENDKEWRLNYDEH